MNTNLVKKIALFALLLLVFLDAMGYGLIFPILSPLFLSDQGMLPAHTSLAMRDFLFAMMIGVFSFFMFVTTPVLGDLSDRLGRKPLLLFCLFGTSVSALICALGIYLHNVELLLIGRIFSGLTAGSQAVGMAAIIDVSEPHEKTKHFGWMALAGSVGFAIGPFIGGYFSNPHIVSWFAFWTPFAIDAILAFINAVLLIFTYVSHEKKSSVKHEKMTWLKPIIVLVEAMKDRGIRNLSIVLLCYETSWALYFQYIAIFLFEQFHLSSAHIGYYMSFIAMMLAITFVVIIRILLMFFSERPIVLGALLVTGLLIPFHIFFKSLFAQYLIVIPISIGSGLVWNAILTLFSNSVDTNRQGWVMGVSSSITSVSWIFGAALAGWLAYLGMTLAFSTAAALMLLGFGLLLVTKA